jgi:hypothetical protein
VLIGSVEDGVGGRRGVSGCGSEVWEGVWMREGRVDIMKDVEEAVDGEFKARG